MEKRKSALNEVDDRLLGSTQISRWGYSCSKAIDEFLALAFFRKKEASGGDCEMF